MLIRLVSILALTLGTSSTFAQQQNNDYYSANSDPVTKQLLGNVERYHMQPGLDQIKAKQYYPAWGSFDFILRYFPNHPRALMEMARVCDMWRDPRCSMDAYFDRAIQLSPESARIYLIRGTYLQRHGKFSEAIESYKKSLELDPGSANAHYNIGLAYLDQKEFDLANQHAQKAYARGMTLPGLRNKLVAANAWKPMETTPVVEAPTVSEAPLPPGDSASSDESKH